MDSTATAAANSAPTDAQREGQRADRTAALRKLREAVMTANASIALRGL